MDKNLPAAGFREHQTHRLFDEGPHFLACRSWGVPAAGLAQAVNSLCSAVRLLRDLPHPKREPFAIAGGTPNSLKAAVERRA